MTTNAEGAVNEIYNLFTAGWNAGASAIVGYIPKIQYYGIDEGETPDNSKFWVRLSTQEVNSEQGTLSESVVSQGSKRYETYGLIFLQIFAPKRSDAITIIRKLAQLAKSIFHNSTTNVIIRNASIKEAPSENGAIRFNVIAEYEFSEID